MSTFIVSHTRNITAAYYKPIGQIITRWNWTEHSLLTISGHILEIKNPKAVRLLTWGLRDKWEVLGALAARWLPDKAEQREFKTIVGMAKHIRNVRNYLAHNLWGFGPRKPRLYELFYVQNQKDQPLRRRRPRPDLLVLKRWASQVNDLNRRIETFRKHRGAPPT
jgi:hypothetical protein